MARNKASKAKTTPTSASPSASAPSAPIAAAAVSAIASASPIGGPLDFFNVLLGASAQHAVSLHSASERAHLVLPPYVYQSPLTPRAGPRAHLAVLLDFVRRLRLCVPTLAPQHLASLPALTNELWRQQLESLL